MAYAYGVHMLLMQVAPLPTKASCRVLTEEPRKEPLGGCGAAAMASSPFPPGSTAADFPFAGTVLEVAASESLQRGFKLLVSHNLLSVPVFDAANQRYLGFLDITDCIRFSTMSAVHEDSREIGTLLKSLDGHEFAVPWVECSLKTPMAEIVSLLKTRTKRVPILDKGKCVKIISQSQVAKIASDWLGALPQPHPARFTMVARDCEWAHKTVVTLPEDALAKDAFNLIVSKNLSAVGILDEEGDLLTCITAKDIRVVAQLDGHASVDEVLSLPAVEFVSKARTMFEKLGKGRPAIITVHDDTPVEAMVHKLAKTHTHRVFVTASSSEHKATGVFTVGDVVRLLE